jgi:hypothetical protein
MQNIENLNYNYLYTQIIILREDHIQDSWKDINCIYI